MDADAERTLAEIDETLDALRERCGRGTALPTADAKLQIEAWRAMLTAARLVVSRIAEHDAAQDAAVPDAGARPSLLARLLGRVA